MGDPRRFNALADLAVVTFPEHRGNAVADVAGGKGGLKAALYLRGWHNVTTIDKRHRLAKSRSGQRYARFTPSFHERFSLVLSMHPDEATDNAVLYAARWRVPFIVVPCCVKPDAAPYAGRPGDKSDWIRHVARLADRTHVVETRVLPISGDAVALVGVPRRMI